ncbi:hypothetical protein IT575_03475 [bacterium]|nr:hypothetical protein [bacterium]
MQPFCPVSSVSRLRLPAGLLLLGLTAALALLAACGRASAGQLEPGLQTAPAAFASLGLPGPDSLLRSASAYPALRLGSQHLPQTGAGLQYSGYSAVLSPQPGQGMDGLAWAVYGFNAEGLGGNLNLSYGFEPGMTGAAQDFWLAVANFSQQRWDWHSAVPSGALSLNANTNLQDGQALVVLAFRGSAPWQLNWVRLGPAGPSPHDVITAGCSSVLGGHYISRSTCDNPSFEPLLWASQDGIGGDKLGLQRTQPVPGWAGYHYDGRVLFWSGHEGFWGTGNDAKGDNDLFRTQALRWLLDGGTKVLCLRSHGGGPDSSGFSAAVKAALAGEGVSFTDSNAAPTAELLAEYDLVYIGHGDSYTPEEVDTVMAWLEAGGSLLLAAQGWVWSGEELPLHPLNQFGARFGCWISNGLLSDASAPNGQADTPNFAVAPLSEYKPARVIVLRTSETDVNTVKELAAASPNDIYVVEGQHMGLQLLSSDWPLLNDPLATINTLDQMYLEQVAMVGDQNRPYGGELTWIITQHAPSAGWYMHSGNPIVIQDYASGDLVQSFNDHGHPGWGLPHEHGHNMHLSACAYLFGADAVEPCANIWSVRTFERMGWDLNQSGHPDYYQAGYDYHYAPTQNYSDVQASAWIWLGLLDLIWKKYGWEGMESFLAEAALDAKNGVTAPDDAFRTAYLVEGLSAAYSLDFSPLFDHWDFPLTDATRAATDVYPDAEIPWN